MIGLADIEAARARIAPYVGASPIVAMARSGLKLKAESLHATGAFKLRGAFNAILSLDAAQRRAGVVAHSSGNHALAVAFAARALGVAATVVMPRDAPAVKAEGVRRCGARMVIVGGASAERARRAEEIAAEEGLSPIPPFDAEAILEGTGTIGLEILDAMDAVKAIYAPVSGGGLIGGMAAAIKLSRPEVKVIGVEPELAADAFASFRAGEIVTLPAEDMARTMADGLRVQRLGAITWPYVRTYVDEMITVSEDAIAEAMRRVAFEARLVAEPSGAVAAAGALAHAADPARTVAILSGGNVDAALYARILAG